MENSLYASPTDMGVNMPGFAIVDNGCGYRGFSTEIIRRYYQMILDFKQSVSESAIKKNRPLMNDLGITPLDRKKQLFAVCAKVESTKRTSLL